MTTKTGDYQINSEYVFAYNNKDRHKDVYDAKTRKDCNKDRMLMIIVHVQNTSYCFTLVIVRREVRNATVKCIVLRLSQISHNVCKEHG